MKELLKLRREIKKRKPSFIRQDAHKKPKLKEKWRKPKGTDSKMRLNLKGYRKSPSKGWRSPKQVRNLDPSGLKPIRISTEQELAKIDKESQGIIIAKTTGLKKRLAIIKKAIEQKIQILNIKNPEEFAKSKQAEREKKKQERQKKEEQKSKKQKAKEKKSEEKKEDLTEKLTEEDKKEEEKKEKEKILRTKST